MRGYQVFWMICVVLFSSEAMPQTPANTTENVMLPVTIRFVAQVNGVSFDCHKAYANVGQTRAIWQPQDFRMYVHDVQLVRASGEAVSVALQQDGVFQRGSVALLDFEDGTGNCMRGTPQTHTQIQGTILANHDYVGLRFVLGVPFDNNHQVARAALPPFDQPDLYTDRRSGYKFMRLEGRVDKAFDHSVWLMSTGCLAEPEGYISKCKASNEVVIDLPHFDADRQVVVADIGRLFEKSILQSLRRKTPRRASKKQAPTPLNGCHSEPNNLDCRPIFSQLGIPWIRGEKNAGQKFFSVQ